MTTPKVPCTCPPQHDDTTCPHYDECYEEWLHTRVPGHAPD